jgi:hypothetical protein
MRSNYYHSYYTNYYSKRRYYDQHIIVPPRKLPTLGNLKGEAGGGLGISQCMTHLIKS